MIEYSEFRKSFTVTKTTNNKTIDVYYVREKPHVDGRSIETTALSPDAAEWLIGQIYQGQVNNMAEASSRSSGQFQSNAG